MNLLEGINPVTRLLAIILIATPLLFTLDTVSAAVVLGATLVLAPLCGMSWVRLLKRSWPLLIAGGAAAISMAFYGQPGGETYLQFWLIQVTDQSLGLAAAIFVRVLAVSLPVFVLIADMDATDVGDGLGQILKLPQRFVVGAVAAIRLLSLLRDDLDATRRARRARGLSDQRGPRYWVGVIFGLLVVSLRRGGKLATAMEARGFGRYPTRTWARESTLNARDWVVLAFSLALGVGALLAAWWAGTFNFLGLG